MNSVLNLIGKRCYYQTRGSTQTSSSKIVDVEIKVRQDKSGRIMCILENGLYVVLHEYDLYPNYIGNLTWGFLTAESCEEYWDM